VKDVVTSRRCSAGGGGERWIVSKSEKGRKNACGEAGSGREDWLMGGRQKKIVRERSRGRLAKATRMKKGGRAKRVRL